MTNIDLADIVNNYIVYIDTCSLMAENQDFLAKELPPILIKHSKQVRILAKVVEEINRHLKSDKETKKLGAQKAKKIIDEYKKFNLVIFKGEDADPFADATFQTIFTKFRTTHNLCLITKDHGLALDIGRLRALNSVQSYKNIKLFRNSKSGLEDWDDIFQKNPKYDSFTRKSTTLTAQTSKTTTIKQSNLIDKFQLHQQPTNEVEKLLNVVSVPNESDYVNSLNLGRIKLIKKLAAGGEGTVYSIDKDPNLVCKIYKTERLTNLRKKKLELMATKKIDCQGICWPKEVVYNLQGEFVGYLMAKAEGKDLGKTLFIKPIFMKTFPMWTRKNLANLCIRILEKIKYLHDRNIILGDINPFNILIKNDNEIFFVDTDSYQIEQYPCPVGTITYTPPELHQIRKKYCDYLRTFENENFAVATLLFMILLPGKAPYDQIGGDSIIDGIKAMDFSYPLGVRSTKKAPKGLWRFMWSNLTFDLKYSFYNTFNAEKELDSEKGEHRLVKYFRKNERLPVIEWIKLFEIYQSFLNKNPASCDLYPENFKLLNPVNAVCDICGKQKQAEKDRIAELSSRGKNFICWSCFELIEMQKNMDSSKSFAPHKSSSRTVYRPSSQQNISQTLQSCSQCYGKGKITCKSCNGSGKQYSVQYVRCSTCQGTGSVSTFFGFFSSTCPDCYGKKQINKTLEVKCQKCNGTGNYTCSNCNGKGKF